MKKKVAFWVVMILVNAFIGVVSIRSYLNMNDRIASIEAVQKIHSETSFRTYQDIRNLQSTDKKIVAALQKALGVDGKYDFNNNLAREWDLNKFFNYKTYVRTVVTLEVPEELRALNPDSVKITTKVSEAPAMVIGRYVLTVSHVSDAEILSRQTIRINTPMGALELIHEFKVLEYGAALLMADGSKYSLKELYRNKEKDFALFRMPENAKAPNFPFEVGKSDELKVGHYLYMNGRPSIPFEVARPGYVTALADMLPNVKGDKKHEIEISQPSDSGDSGSPVIAFRDGKPEMVGIYLGWFGQGDDNGKNTRSRALKINTAVDEIKEKLGLDLRELQRKILNK